ncbi:hypothetical protein MXD62_25545, partial [Frankia sp. Mgl5]|nr:hypothetical protein [Frankia sp. Mgl5]
MDGSAQADVPPIQGGDDAGAPYPTGGPDEPATTAEQLEPPAGVTGTIAGPSGDGDGYVPPGAPLDAGGADLGVVQFDGADYVTQQSDGSWAAGHLDSTDLVTGVPGGWTAGAEGGYLPAGSGFGATADPDHGGDAGTNGTDLGVVQFNGAGYIAPNGDGSGSVGHIDGATFVAQHPGGWTAGPESGYVPDGSGFGATADPDYGGSQGTVQFNGAGYIAPNGDGSGSVGHIDGA